MNYLFVNPCREDKAVKANRSLSEMLPVRVSTLVPPGEVWWAHELPDESEIHGDIVRTVRRLRIIHKLTIDR